jgi:hypothetical protein
MTQAQTEVASWYAFDNANNSQHTESADSTASGWTASLETSTRGSATTAAAQSSTRDAGTTGPVVDPTTTDVSGLQANAANTGHATTTITFVNSTQTSVPLGGFHYDYKKTASADSATTDWGTIDLIAVSNITGAAEGSTLNQRAVGTANYFSQGVNVNLAGLSIASGATATISIVVTWDGTTSAGDPGWRRAVTFDNIALTASTNPVVSSGTYYIDATGGSDANSGTSTNDAWQTLARASTDYPQTYNPGDEILLKRGETFTGQLLLHQVKGSTALPISIGAYGTGSDPIIAGSGGNHSIRMTYPEYLEVQDLEITGEGISVSAYWENGTNTYDHLYFRNLNIHDITGSTSNALSLVTSSLGGAKFDDILIEGCTISNVVGKSITINKWQIDNTFFHSNVIISNNTIKGGGIQLGKISGESVVRDNSITGSNGSDGLTDTDSGLWIWNCRDLLIERNVFEGARGANDACGVHIDIANEDCVIQYNLSRDNEGGFAEILGSSSNNVYRYNISINDGARENGVNGAYQDGKMFFLGGYMGVGNPKEGPYNNYIYNNTIFTKASIVSKFQVDDTASGALIANNIIYIEGSTSNLTLSSTATNILFKNNLVYQGKVPGAPFTVTDTSSADPIFTNPGWLSAMAYVPANTNQVVDQGITITNLPGDAIGLDVGFAVTEDYFGNPIYGAPDMGAIEVSSLSALAGWHTWTVADAAITNQSPNETLSGYAGNMGASLIGSGGGQKTVATESGDNTYGSATRIASRTEDSSVLLQASDEGNNDLRRLDFLVTNNTGQNIDLGSVHIQFDYRLTYGSNSTTTIKLAHLSGASDLDDQPWSGYNLMAPKTLSEFVWQNEDVDISNTAMNGVVWTNGTSAAFRIEVGVDAGAIAAGVNIDNLAVSMYVSPVVSVEGYAAWADDWGDVDLSDLTADMDGDGQNNLLEYALGGNPTNGFVDGHIPSFGMRGNAMEYRFMHRVDDSSLTYQLETNSDLVFGTWTNTGYTVEGTADQEGLFREVTNSIPTADTKMFMRLKVERN